MYLCKVKKTIVKTVLYCNWIRHVQVLVAFYWLWGWF